MKNGIHHIDIVLENCEVIKVNGKHIGHFNINNIQTHIRRCAINSIMKFIECDQFFISINRKANILEDIFGQSNMGKQKVFDRLKGCDITSIDIYYDTDPYDGDDFKEEHDTIYVPWGESEYHNDYMTCKENIFGDLFIVIDKNETIDSLLGEEINEEEINHMWLMYE